MDEHCHPLEVVCTPGYWAPCHIVNAEVCEAISVSTVCPHIKQKKEEKTKTKENV